MQFVLTRTDSLGKLIETIKPKFMQAKNLMFANSTVIIDQKHNQ